MTTLKMGTRGSALALAQSSQAARALEKLNPGLTVETVVIKTSGDQFGVPTPEVAKNLPQGAKGLWVKELEEALLDGRVDFAAHSGKDMPALLAAGCSIAAYPEREDPRDAFVPRPGLTWASLNHGAKVATSSLRRHLMILAAKPGVNLMTLRGNVDTRLRKLKDGEFDAMVIAVAGLKRLGRGDVPHEPLDVKIMLPAPAQGALALEIRSDRKDVAGIVAKLDHAPTRACVEFERAFLAAVDGGCGSPVGAYARLQSGGVLFEGFLALDGEKIGKRVAGLCGDVARREAFIADLAAQAKAR
ncbi:MAG TPA: hydroxymethylbilane synthase [Elusimicrobiota bacterium]|nr:hydroxymethylbilane synthase [Elusimicrobiota bacterium]